MSTNIIVLWERVRVPLPSILINPPQLLVSDYLTSLLEVPRKFTKESTQLLQRCTKPDKRGTPHAPLSPIRGEGDTFLY